MIPDISIGNNSDIPVIQVNGTGVRLIQTIRPSNIGVRNIADVRVWSIEPPSVNTLTVPVTMQVGTPVVNMPGCVKVHKELSLIHI